MFEAPMCCRLAFCWFIVIGAFVIGNSPADAACLTDNAEPLAMFIKTPLCDNGIDKNANPIQVADADVRPNGVRLTTTWSSPILNQGDTIVNTLDVYNAIAGQKIRIQNSNHGASYFMTNLSTSVQAGVATVPGVTYSQVSAQQMEITLAPGTYKIPITQTVTLQGIPGGVDDATWAPGTQLQTDWLLSSAPSNGAPVESGYAVDSKWITYSNQGGSPVAQKPVAAKQGTAPDARWSLLRSIPNIGVGGTVTFEIGMTNFALTTSTTLQIAVNSGSTASDADFTQGLNSSIASAADANVTFDPQTSTLTFSPKVVFPFSFTMTAKSVGPNKDYILNIKNSKVGQIDVAEAGVRLGTLTMPARRPLLGLNEDSGEFGVGNYNFKYTYPGKDRIDWVSAQGFGIIRVPFLFPNIQASSSAVIDEQAMRLLDPVLRECAALRIVCLLDMHNYGNYYFDDLAKDDGMPGTIGVSNARLANLWAQIANRYKENAYVWFGLMNEPNKQTALEWVKTANAIAAAIRATGAAQKIVFQGAGWDNAWKWVISDSARQMLKAYDPGNNYAFEAHQYLDSDGSGTSPNCVAGFGARLEPFTTWLLKYGLQGIIGEVGWSANEGCLAEAKTLLDSWQAATTSTGAGGYIALTYFAAGPWWADGYMYLAEPRPFPAGPEPIQLKLIKRYLPH